MVTVSVLRLRFGPMRPSKFVIPFYQEIVHQDVIPTALTIDRSPRSGCDGSDAVVVVCEECPGVAGLVENVVVTVEDGDREFIATQIFPDVFDRVEFWRVGR